MQLMTEVSAMRPRFNLYPYEIEKLRSFVIIYK